MSLTGPSLDQLKAALAANGLGHPVAVEELTGGSNATSRIDLADGSSVVLQTYDAIRGKLPIREAYASSLVAGLGLPTTRYLMLDETRTLLPYPFALTSYLPGVPV